VKYARKSMA